MFKFLLSKNILIKNIYDNFVSINLHLLKSFNYICKINFINLFSNLLNINYLESRLVKRIILYNNVLIDFKIIINYFIINNNCFRNFRIKLNLCSIPLITNKGSFIINNYDRTIIGVLNKSSTTLLFIDNNNIILSISPILGPDIKFILNNRRQLNISFFNSLTIPLIIFFSLIGLKKRLYLNKFNILNFLLFYNNIFFITVNSKYILIKNNNKNYYNKFLLLIKRSSFKLLKYFLKEYNNLYYYINYKIVSLLVIAKSFKLGKLFFRKNVRINVNKILLLNVFKFLIIVYNFNYNVTGKYILNLFLSSFCYSKKIYLNKLYKYFNIIKPSDNIYHDLFDLRKYKISSVNRNILNRLIGNKLNKFNLSIDYNDFINIFKTLILLNYKKKVLSNIDNIYNKKIFFIGELINNLILEKLKLSFELLRRKINSFYSLFEIKWFFNKQILTSFIKEFFTISPYSQFTEQLNYLTELSHKRKLTLLSQNQLSTEIFNSNIRFINNSYYGKLCPIETPEGKNLGLTSSLALLSIIKNNIILTPYIFISKNKFSLYYLDSLTEYDYKIIDLSSLIYINSVKLFLNKKSDLFDFSILPTNYLIPLYLGQQFSITTLFIPFMEYNDGNRVLMGTNMQKQSLPCLNYNLPIISTGFEIIPSISLKYCNLISLNNKLFYSDSNNIIYFKYIKNFLIIKNYILKKFISSNQNSLINQNLCNKKVILFNKLLLNDNNSTINGYLCLGQNLLVGYLPWKGYNFEDSIIISDSIINNNKFTSIHIYNYEISLNNSFYKKDIVTLDLENNINNLTNYNNGVIKVGTFVNSGDVLVYRYSYNDNIHNIKNSFNNLFKKNKSLLYRRNFFRLPVGLNGIVISVNSCDNNCYCLLIYLLYFIINKNYLLNKIKFNSLYLKYLFIIIKNKLILYHNNFCNFNNNKFIIKVAVKKILSVGDKLSGRYGNKGVVSKIINSEEMPYLLDGTPLEIILNPLGIPSRMNVGQLYEVKFGLIIYFLFNIINLFKNNKYIKLNKLYNYLFRISIDTNISIYNFYYIIINKLKVKLLIII